MKFLLAFYILVSSIACNCSKKTQAANNATTSENSMGQEAVVTEQSLTPIGVFFSSMASGPADDTFLKEWAAKYIKENNISLVSDKYSGCGKEGEFIIVLNLGKVSHTKALDFKTALEKVVNKQVEINKTTNSSAGPINIEYDVKQERYSYCRLGSKKWL